MREVFIVHAVTTLYMTGLIWFVQIVHYPLFALVGTANYTVYQVAHQRLTTWVVGPPMLAELVTAFLIVKYSASRDAATIAWLGLVLLGAIWLTTAFISVPAHERLSQSFDPATHQWLVLTNWIRTIGWTIRSGLAVWLLMTSKL